MRVLGGIVSVSLISSEQCYHTKSFRWDWLSCSFFFASHLHNEFLVIERRILHQCAPTLHGNIINSLDRWYMKSTRENYYTAIHAVNSTYSNRVTKWCISIIRKTKKNRSRGMDRKAHMNTIVAINKHVIVVNLLLWTASRHEKCTLTAAGIARHICLLRLTFGVWAFSMFVLDTIFSRQWNNTRSSLIGVKHISCLLVNQRMHFPHMVSIYIEESEMKIVKNWEIKRK